jgi:hypothetical protein
VLVLQMILFAPCLPTPRPHFCCQIANKTCQMLQTATHFIRGN